MLQESSAAASFWEEHLSGELASPVLPHHAALPRAHPSRADVALSSEIEDLAAAAGGERLAALVALAGALLSRYGGSESVVVGIRTRGGDALVRLVAGERSFRALAESTAAEVCSVIPYALDGFDELFESAGRPAFPLVAVLEDVAAPIDDVLAAIAVDGDAIVCRSSRLHPATVESVARHLATLAGSCASDVDAGLLTRAYLEPDERERLIDAGRAPRVPYPADVTLGDLFDRVAAERPNAIAIVEGEREISYGDLAARAERYARALRERGIGAGDLVGVCLDRTTELLAAILGVLRAGAAYVPLDPGYPRERLRTILDDAGVALVVTQHRHAALVGGAWESMLVDEPLRVTAPLRAGRRPATSRDLAYVIYTSGSTGRPKGVAVEHRSVVSFVAWCGRQFSPDERAGILFSTSICFDVSVFEVFGPLCTGGTLILAPDLLALASLASRDRIRVVSSTTAGLAEVVRNGTLPRSVRIVMQAGEFLPRSIAHEIMSAGVETLYNLCGATEDTVYSTIFRVRGDEVEDPPIGRPFENRRAFVLDGAGEPVPDGIPGELWYAGPGVAREYYKRPDLTAQRFVPNPFRTGEDDERLYRSGDLVRRRPDGALHYLGRLDQQVKIRGFRIELAEVEAVVAQHPAIFESAVVVRNNVRDEAEIVGYLVARPGVEPPSAQEVRDFVAARLPAYMVPASVVTLPVMPLSPSGKLDRSALPAPYRTVATVEGPRTRTETALHALWREMLGVEPIGLDDNFFVLGGHSLLAARMIARAEAVFQRADLMPAFAASPTIRTLAERIEHDFPVAPLGSVVKVNAPLAGAPPLFFLHGMFNGDGFYVWNVAKHLPKTFGLYAVHPYGNGGTPPPPTIEAMASAHLREIRALQPHGPYRLGGFCNGGLIAFEMARQLRAEGEAVERLVIVAANALNARTRRVREAIRVAGALMRIPPRRQALIYERAIGYTKKLADLVYDPFERRWRGWREVRSVAAKLQGIRQRRLATDGIGSGRFDRQYEIAVSEYFPGPYDGDVLVVVGSESTVEGSEDPTLGWDRMARSVRVVRIPGGHHAVEEHPENFAAILREW